MPKPEALSRRQSEIEYTWASHTDGPKRARPTSSLYMYKWIKKPARRNRRSDEVEGGFLLWLGEGSSPLAPFSYSDLGNLLRLWSLRYLFLVIFTCRVVFFCCWLGGNLCVSVRFVIWGWSCYLFSIHCFLLGYWSFEEGGLWKVEYPRDLVWFFIFYDYLCLMIRDSLDCCVFSIAFVRGAIFFYFRRMGFCWWEDGGYVFNGRDSLIRWK